MKDPFQRHVLPLLIPPALLLVITGYAQLEPASQ